MECKVEKKRENKTFYNRFNRDIVECKVFYFLSIYGGGKRFNRDIVECKANTLDLETETIYRFNRDIVECKDSNKVFFAFNNSDLIETLWNVKNSSVLTYSTARARFNRDIVECKESVSVYSVVFPAVI